MAIISSAALHTGGDFAVLGGTPLRGGWLCGNDEEGGERLEGGGSSRTAVLSSSSSSSSSSSTLSSLLSSPSSRLLPGIIRSPLLRLLRPDLSRSRSRSRSFLPPRLRSRMVSCNSTPPSSSARKQTQRPSAKHRKWQQKARTTQIQQEILVEPGEPLKPLLLALRLDIPFPAVALPLLPSLLFSISSFPSHASIHGRSSAALCLIPSPLPHLRQSPAISGNLRQRRIQSPGKTLRQDE